MEALSQPLGISKHPHLKGVDGTFMFSYRALLTYWKGNYSPGQIICTFKNVKKQLFFLVKLFFVSFTSLCFLIFSTKNINSLCNITRYVNFDSLRTWGLLVDKG